MIAGADKIFVQYYDGSNWYYPADLIYPIQVGKWYVVVLTMAENGTFHAEVWQKDNPAVRGAYQQQMASGLNWRFHHWIYSGTAWLDNYREGGYQTTLIAYDALGRKTWMNDPDMGQWL